MASGDAAARVAVQAQRRVDALKAADEGGLLDVLHEDLVHIHASGRFDTRQKLVDSVVQAKIVYRRIEASDVRIVEANALTTLRTGNLSTTVIVNGEEKLLETAFLETWIRSDDGKWRMIAWQATPRIVPPSEGGSVPLEKSN
ncbi:nuclear transport factor 2 family protein [Aquibium sp. LZ166]|uniref:Nuclear transport factor 2 family protein n=1 Tax=Aquibium pacificus TaxID=3153579 RepID=A0ABV3SKV3_9HYPH